MKQALLLFPDVGSMTEFILKNRLSNIQADSKQCSISGIFTDKQLTIAEGLYGARVMYLRTIEWYEIYLLNH